MKPAELIIDGKNTFPLLFEEIERCEKTIYIRMFIWRNDAIGKELAERLLAAADRGVKIILIKDRYGLTCEYMEEDFTSMFHPTLTMQETLWVRTLQIMYHPDHIGGEHLNEKNPLRLAMMNQPNISLQCDHLLHDHTKLYIFDERIMIFGGVNVEDKENGFDREGREYHDFMVRLEGEDYVRLYRKRVRGCFSRESAIFGINQRKPVFVYEMKERFLNLIRGSRKELTILMSYFAPVPEIIEAIHDALKRGVVVRIMIPEHANTGDDINRMTMKDLFVYAKTYAYDLSVYLHPGMPHTKLLISENEITVGSCNIIRNAFNDLCELNYFQANDDSPFARQVKEAVEERIRECRKVSDAKELSFHYLRAQAEHTRF